MEIPAKNQEFSSLVSLVEESVQELKRNLDVPAPFENEDAQLLSRESKTVSEDNDLNTKENEPLCSAVVPTKEEVIATLGLEKVDTKQELNVESPDEANDAVEQAKNLIETNSVVSVENMPNDNSSQVSNRHNSIECKSLSLKLVRLGKRIASDLIEIADELKNGRQLVLGLQGAVSLSTTADFGGNIGIGFSQNLRQGINALLKDLSSRVKKKFWYIDFHNESDKTSKSPYVSLLMTKKAKLQNSSQQNQNPKLHERVLDENKKSRNQRANSHNGRSNADGRSHLSCGEQQAAESVLFDGKLAARFLETITLNVIFDVKEYVKEFNNKDKRGSSQHKNNKVINNSKPGSKNNNNNNLNLNQANRDSTVIKDQSAKRKITKVKPFRRCANCKTYDLGIVGTDTDVEEEKNALNNMRHFNDEEVKDLIQGLPTFLSECATSRKLNDYITITDPLSATPDKLQ